MIRRDSPEAEDIPLSMVGWSFAECLARGQAYRTFLGTNFPQRSPARIHGEAHERPCN